MYCVLTSWIVGPINHTDEEEDEKGYTDDDLEGVEEHKTIILHLLSQLKLGMDLTKVLYKLQLTSSNISVTNTYQAKANTS